MCFGSLIFSPCQVVNLSLYYFMITCPVSWPQDCFQKAYMKDLKKTYSFIIKWIFLILQLFVVVVVFLRHSSI